MLTNLLALTLCLGILFQTNNNQKHNIQTTTLAPVRKVSDPVEVIDLKHDVMFHYYKECINNGLYSEDFEWFCRDYENSALSMVDFISSLSNNLEAYASSTNVTYGLGTVRQAITPLYLFPNGVPLYNAFEFNNIEFGDILMESFENSYHTAVVTNTSKQATTGDFIFTYIETVESLSPDGVQICYVDDQRIIDKNIKILRYRYGFTERQISDINYFLNYQLGKPYCVSATVDYSIYSESWYCNELIYSAFLFAGIDLLPGTDMSSRPLIGTAFAASVVMHEVDIAYNPYLTISINGKRNGKWNVNIFNQTRTSKDVYYNRKMCFLNDGKTWTNLNDINESPIRIGAYSYSNVNISTNFFADSIAASYVVTMFNRTERFVTYGNGLSQNLQSYNEKQNIIYE